MPVNTTIKIRKGTESEWQSSNPVLSSGEPGYVTDSNRFKIGDGSSNWNSLSYASVVPSGFLAGSGISLSLGNNGSSLTISSTGVITVSNYVNNRLLTSDGTSTGINAENNLSFDGSLLSVSGNFIARTGIVDLLSFNTNNGAVSVQGEIGWNSTEGTVDIALEDNVSVQINEHRILRVRNTTNGTLYKGQVVYASGVHANGIITPNLYVADGSIQEIRFIGMMLADVRVNNNGYAIDFGHVNNIDTRGNVATNYAVGDETWADGDILYVHPTVAGKLTKVEPKHAISVAYVLDAASNGKIFARPTNFGDLNQLHDVNISGATNGQFLQYNSVIDYWVPSSSGNFTSLTINNSGVPVGSGTTNYISRWTGSSILGTGILFDNGSSVIVGNTSSSFKFDVTSGANNNIMQATTQGYTGFDLKRSTNGYSELTVKDIGGRTIAITSHPNDLPNTVGYVAGVAQGVGAGVTLSTPFDADNRTIALRARGDIVAFASLGGSATERLRITSSGNVGIGTSSPSYILDVAGTGNFSQNLLVNGTGVSISGHKHTSSDITNFNSAVSGLLPTITNSGDNRILTSTGSTVGINGESNLTFDGANLSIGTLNNNDPGNISVYNSNNGDTSSSLIFFTSSGNYTLWLGSSDDDDLNQIISYSYPLTIASLSTLNIGSTSGTSVYFGNFKIDNQTANTVASFDANKNVVSLSTGTYPSLTELSYVKDVTSAIQTQLNGKQNTLTNPVTGTGVANHIAYWNSTSGIVADSGQLYWDSTNNRLGLGTTSPLYTLDILGNGNFSQNLLVNGTGVSLSGHTHTASQITDFNEAVDDRIGTGLFVAGTGINLNYNDGSNSFTVSVTGLVSSPANNRILTSRDNTTTGIDAESNLTFDGSNLVISSGLTAATGNFTTSVSGALLDIDNIRIDGNTISSTNSNGNIIIQPNGTGALQRDSGGNSRGSYSIDWQTARSSANQVARANYSVIGGGNSNLIIAASEYSIIGGGVYNTINGSNSYRSVIGGGASNNITGTQSYYCTIGGGGNNTISGTYSYHSTICGGYTNQIIGYYSQYSTVCGGYRNYISGYTSYYSSIGGGYNNTISGTNSYYSNIDGGASNTINGSYSYHSTIGGGSNNTISGYNSNYSSIGGGQSNTISGYDSNYGTIGGGSSNTINGFYSYYGTIPGGYQSAVSRYGELSHAAGCFANPGDAQHTILIARKTTSNNTANQILYLNDSSATLTLPAKTSWTFEIKLSAYNDTDSAAAGWIFRGVIRRNGSNGTALVGSLIEENWKDTAMNSTSASVVADDTNEALQIRVTGLTGKNIRWVAVVDISQVSYGTP